MDDCSTDGTSEWFGRNLANSDGIWAAFGSTTAASSISLQMAHNQASLSFTILFHEENRGKGAALKTGFSYALGRAMVIHDADLEYDPHDWSRMLPLITADVAYG